MRKQLFAILFMTCIVHQSAGAQPERWQQHIAYQIDVNMNAETNRFTGVENIVYTNNSPDTFNRVFFHLYWNAFQPNSSMDVRSRELGKIATRQDRNGSPIPDWDARVKDRISKLQPNEIGYDSVTSIVINGVEQKLIYHETILEVALSAPILPNSKTNMKVAFKAQVPIQIRRSGRDNEEGVRYSMSQWYPKMAEYDYQGWNANSYIAREFYGVWGNFDVKITIDKRYIVAATGVLQHADEIGFGYEKPGMKVPEHKGNTITWNFIGNNVHDFVWAADPDYKHLSKKVRPGLVLNVFYKAGDAHTDSAWNNVLWSAEKVLPYIEKHFGPYPYSQYSFIQGGDGGMEYAMATLLKGPGLGTFFHEWMHSWYQQILGTNESLYPWMDEGFTTYAESEVMAWYNENIALQSPYTSIPVKNYLKNKVIEDANKLPKNQYDSYMGYFALARSPYEEPMSTHSDHYNTNFGYSLAAYSKGALFLEQLGYIISDSLRDKVLLAYYNTWKFKHPNANDFIRVAEKVSNIELEWYKEYWVYTTKTIDYGIGDINVVNNQPQITLKRIGKMPMPIDVLVTYKDGTTEMHYIPMNLMYGIKPAEDATPRIIHAEWKWTDPEYNFSISKSIRDIKSVEIDPSQRMADVNRSNNKLVIPE
ncbi:M1 family metallopeptidase [Hydrotalea sp.]|uniref:M1 family metallopeptidase n=2 Tax=Hydrotalea sp. TaxID=2881279 RepID=UPI002607F946|nr:M1 family metallopeptidase [Hydrotalea sp.]